MCPRHSTPAPTCTLQTLGTHPWAEAGPARTPAGAARRCVARSPAHAARSGRQAGQRRARHVRRVGVSQSASHPHRSMAIKLASRRSMGSSSAVAACTCLSRSSDTCRGGYPGLLCIPLVTIPGGADAGRLLVPYCCCPHAHRARRWAGSCAGSCVAMAGLAAAWMVPSWLWPGLSGCCPKQRDGMRGAGQGRGSGQGPDERRGGQRAAAWDPPFWGPAA